MNYKDAMTQLQSMFADFDRETIKAVLVSNRMEHKLDLNIRWIPREDNRRFAQNDG